MIKHAPGEAMPPRSRSNDTLLVFLDAGTVQIKDEKRKALVVKHGVSHVVWRLAGTTDTVKNLSKGPTAYFEVEIKPRAGAKALTAFPALDPVEIDRNHYKVLLENEKVRVVRAVVKAGDKIPMHQHDTSRVNIFVTPHDVRVTDPQGVAKEGHEPSRSVKVGGPCKHDEVSLSKGTMDTVIIDSKLLP